jgi:molybdopterin-dependent oxidoreductase alpha subunit
MSNKLHNRPLEEQEEITLGATKNVAVGVPAITSSIQHMLKYMKPGEALKASLKINQKKGFDCPGCAWPDPDDDRSKIGEYCENGIKAIAEERTAKKIKADFFAKHSVQEMSAWDDFTIGKKGRLTEPMYLPKGASHYEKISWEDAFSKLGDKLKNLASPHEAIFYTSGRTSNEAAFLYQLFVREFGTNNLPDCSNMCHESSGVGLSGTVGIGKGSVTLQDFEEAEVVLVIGQNPGTNHPRMLNALEKTKQNGGKIVAVNPLPEAGLMKYVNPQSPLKILKGGVALSDIFLQVRANGDVALLKALMKLMYDAEQQNPGTVFDLDFIKNKTAGYDALIENIKNVNAEDLAKDAGVSFEDVKACAKLLIENKKIIICWAMGITQHENGVANVQEIVNLLLLKGSIGKPGAGTCPVRGHSNVQGDRTMGIWEAPPQWLLDNIEKNFGFTPPQDHGYHVVDAIKAMHEGKGKVFFAMGGNFMSATPDSDYTAEALQKCELTVHVSTKLNRSHLIHGKEALIFPCLGRMDNDHQESGEQFVTVENSMGVVHTSQGIFAPIADTLLSEPKIVAELAKATLGTNTKIDWDNMVANYDNTRNAIEATIPGFDNYNERVRQPAGFYLPNGARKAEFNTTNKKANFTVNEVPENKLKDKQFYMITNRSHDQYNTTVYGMADRYRGIKNGRRVVLINPEDLKELGMQHKQTVHIRSHFNGEERLAKNFTLISYPIARRTVGTYFPETNVLVPINQNAKRSHTPASKGIVISLEAV